MFPTAVVGLLKVNGIDSEACNPAAPGRPLYRLPEAEEWPIVVAVRMSLSFPLLLSAVPLYARDWTLESVRNAHKNGNPTPTTKVWFSDGGISSNMPLHFFDELLPKHPTFAINLNEKHPDADNGNLKTPPVPGFENWRVFLPFRNNEGLHRHWQSPSDSGISGLFGFLWSIIETMQNWRDEIQFPYPGYRDRIVQISLSDDEGGLNLNMSEEAIYTLGNAGENAAERLIERFIDGDGWDNHRKIRLRNLLAQLDLKLDDFKFNEVPDWEALLEKKQRAGEHYKMSENERQLADKALKELADLARELQNAHPVTLAGSSAPHPFAEIRITPRF